MIINGVGLFVIKLPDQIYGPFHMGVIVWDIGLEAMGHRIVGHLGAFGDAAAALRSFFECNSMQV